MESEAKTAKKLLRQQIQTLLRSVDTTSWKAASEAVVQRIKAEPAWRHAQRVLLYAPLRSELDVSDLFMDAFASNKEVAFPRFDAGRGGYVAALIQERDLKMAPGHMGVLEPGLSNPVLPMNRLDFILVPGVAFDLCGRRLGRGKGYYDRLLSDATGDKCGVCLDEQIAPEIPHEAHDIQLNCLVTPTRWLDFGERGS